MNFNEINQPKDKYYLDTNILDDINEYYAENIGEVCRFATNKRLHTLSGLVYYSVKETSMEETVKAYSSRALDFFADLGDYSTRMFAPNINIYSMSAVNSIFLSLRLYGYIHPKKNIF